MPIGKYFDKFATIYPYFKNSETQINTTNIWKLLVGGDLTSTYFNIVLDCYKYRYFYINLLTMSYSSVLYKSIERNKRLANMKKSEWLIYW